MPSSRDGTGSRLSMSEPFHERLARIRTADSLLAVGLMSGTSADGIDVALVRFHGDHGFRDHDGDDPSSPLSGRRGPGADCTPVRFDLLASETIPFPGDVRDQILGALNCSVQELADLDLLLGRLFGEAAVAVARRAETPLSHIDFVGSHGQTVFHRPPTDSVMGATLQIGCAEQIAERVGCPVVSGFRVRDIVVGGHGAPLVPLVDQLLFRDPLENRILLNIGGIANLTALGANPADTIAFDTGPGNALLDSLVRIATEGAETCDRNGLRGLAGSVCEPLLLDLLAHPFLQLPPPRSADRHWFGESLARRLLAENAGLPLDDLLATAACFTADSIAAAISALPPPFTYVDRVIVSGGGVWNGAVMARLRDQLAPAIVETTAEHGLPSDAKEAVAFALLARETLSGRPGNLPRATGARAPVILGQITP